MRKILSRYFKSRIWVQFQNQKVITKHTFDGFNGTALDNVLRENEIDSVIISGIVTGVSSTASRPKYDRKATIILNKG